MEPLPSSASYCLSACLPTAAPHAATLDAWIVSASRGLKTNAFVKPSVQVCPPRLRSAGRVVRPGLQVSLRTSRYSTLPRPLPPIDTLRHHQLALLFCVSSWSLFTSSLTFRVPSIFLGLEARPNHSTERRALTNLLLCSSTVLQIFFSSFPPSTPLTIAWHSYPLYMTATCHCIWRMR